MTSKVKSRRLPHVLTAAELIDYLFSKASKAQGRGGDAAIKSRAIKKLHTIAAAADRELSSYVTGFPSLNEGTFEYEMADILVGAVRIKRAIASVQGCRNNIVTLSNRYARIIAKSESVPEIIRAREEAYGRISSLIRGISDELNLLKKAAESLKEIPEVGGGIVIAGFPNVGKSMLVSRLSGARTRVASYPFTTTTIIPGKTSGGAIVLDSPGLTPRAMSTNNSYERKSIAAIRSLAQVLVYLVDGSGTCGYSVEEQLELYEKIKRMIAPKPAILVYTKADLYKPPGKPAVSAMTGEGIDEFITIISKALEKERSANYQSV
ncbi:MAG: GTPase [Methanomassiliicoccales archaeon]